MMNGDCFTGNWGSFLENLGGWGWIGLILNLLFWVGLIAALAILVVWAIRRARVPADTSTYAAELPTAKQILQARYARGEISREQYELKRQVIG